MNVASLSIHHPMPPANVEAEAALLGALLINNATADLLPADLRAAQFFEPVHRRIFERFSILRARGESVTPVTLRPYFESDEALKDLGGVAYSP